MNNKTPKNWITCKISDLCDFQNGYAFNSNDYVENGMPIIRMSNISVDGNLNLTPENTKYYQTEKAETLKKYILNKNDVVMAMTDMTKDMGIIGKTAIIDEDNRYLLNQRVGRLTIKNSKVLDYKYLHRYTNSPLFLNYAKQQCSGGVQLNLSTKAILEHKMILPPTIQEQQEIAQVLDTMSDIIRLREECISHAQDLIPALFQEMFGNPRKNPLNFKMESLGELCIKIGSGATPKGGKETYQTNGIALVRSMNIHDMEFKYKDLAYINELQAKALNNVELKENDVLFNITGASVARCCILPKNVLPARVNQHVSILRCSEKVNHYFLNALLTFPSVKEQLLNLGKTKGATREAITKTQLESFKIILPDIDHQQQFAQKVIEIESYIKEQKEELENAKQMFQSLLHHAFTGKLTKHKYGEINE